MGIYYSKFTTTSTATAVHFFLLLLCLALHCIFDIIWRVINFLTCIHTTSISFFYYGYICACFRFFEKFCKILLLLLLSAFIRLNLNHSVYVSESVTTNSCLNWTNTWRIHAVIKHPTVWIVYEWRKIMCENNTLRHVGQHCCTQNV